MAFEVRIPTLGESVTEGVIVRWAKRDGEAVKPDEVLLELETDKASMEIAAERAGVLRILKPEGEKVTVGELVARIEEDGAARAGGAPQRGGGRGAAAGAGVEGVRTRCGGISGAESGGESAAGSGAA